MDRIMAVLTKEKRYAERFCGFINRKNRLSLMAVPFDNAEKCASYSRKHNIELLVADYSFFGRGYDVLSSGIDEIKAKKRIFLAETPANYMGLAEPGAAEPYASGAADVYEKYQSAERLLEEIVLGSGGQEFLKSTGKNGKKSAVLGVFSPEGRCGKTSFALTLSRMLSREHRVLYLNLDEFSCISEIFGCSPGEGISEAIYDLKRGVLDGSRINALAASNCGIEWLPPVKSPEDYGMIHGSDYVSLITAIMKASDYEYLVVDMDRYNDQADAIMDVCSKVYIPTMGGQAPGKKTDFFMNFLKRTREREWLGRIEIVELPEPEPMGTSAPEYLDSLCFGKMGDVIRRIDMVDQDER